MRDDHTPSDADLAHAAQAGDMISFGILLERYRPSLHAVALGMLGYGPHVEDAVHDTFLVALTKIGYLREPAAVGGWLHTILRNVCLTRLRTVHVETRPGEIPPYLEPRSLDASPEALIDQLAMREWIWTALAELPETLRVTAMLRYFGSYPAYTDIAAILGVPVGTVRSRLNQVKRQLAEALLATAGLAHDEARDLAALHTQFFTHFYGAHNQGQLDAECMRALATDIAVLWGDGALVHGRHRVGDGLREDQDAGVRLHPTNILVSTNIVVVEGRFENPPTDPFHCPPAISQVFFYQGGMIRQARFYYPSPPAEEGEMSPIR